MFVQNNTYYAVRNEILSCGKKISNEQDGAIEIISDFLKLLDENDRLQNEYINMEAGDDSRCVRIYGFLNNMANKYKVSAVTGRALPVMFIDTCDIPIKSIEQDVHRIISMLILLRKIMHYYGKDGKREYERIGEYIKNLEGDIGIRCNQYDSVKGIEEINKSIDIYYEDSYRKVFMS